MAASKCILCILKIDLILFYDAPNTVFIISSTASSKKTQVKEDMSITSVCLVLVTRKQHCITKE